jgi:hypothetical protein
LRGLKCDISECLGRANPPQSCRQGETDRPYLLICGRGAEAGVKQLSIYIKNIKIAIFFGRVDVVDEGMVMNFIAENS